MLKRIILALVLAAALAGPALAALTNVPTFVVTPRAYKVQIANATGTSAVTLATGATNGTKVLGILVTNTDTNPYTVTLAVTRSATSYVLAVVTVASSSGNVNGTPAVALLTAALIPGLPLDSDGNPYLILESTDTLTVASGGTVTSPKVLSFHTVAGDF